MQLNWPWQNTRGREKTSKSVLFLWDKNQAVRFAGWNNQSLLQPLSSKGKGFFLWAFTYSVLQNICSLNTQVFAKTVFYVHITFGTTKSLSVNWTEVVHSLVSLVTETRISTFQFAIQKHLDCMHYCTMLLKGWSHRLAETKQPKLSVLCEKNFCWA